MAENYGPLGGHRNETERHEGMTKEEYRGLVKDLTAALKNRNEEIDRLRTQAKADEEAFEVIQFHSRGVARAAAETRLAARSQQ